MKAKKVFLGVLLLFLTLCLFACGKITVSLSGDKTVEVGKTIVLTPDASSDATFTWATSNAAIATVKDGTVTGVSAGEVTITVTATAGKKSAEASIKITVVGATASNKPVITGAVDRVVEKGSTFKPTEGVTAWDEEDGDLTSKIKYSGTVRIGAVGEYTATYTVTDSDGNTTSVTVKVTVVANDKDAPLLTGVQNKAIVVGDTTFKLTDGVTANDTIDGDLTSKIQITGTIDPWKLGDYDIQYSVKDESGNEAKATRKITVGLGEFQFAEATDKTFEKEGNDYKFAVALESINDQLAAYALAKLTFKVNATAACELVPAITNGVSQEKIALAAGANEVTIYFRVNAVIEAGELKLTAPEGAALEFSEVKFAFGEAKDTQAPTIEVPTGIDIVLPGTLTDTNALKSFVLNGVTASDNIDGIITSKLDVDFTGIELGNCFDEKDVTIFVLDSSENRTEVKRHVKFVKVYDTKIIEDPEFNTMPPAYDPETHIGWGLNGGSGNPELKLVDGVLVHHNTTKDNPGWDSASSPFYRTTTEILKAYNWYMLKFDVKAEVARKMTVRIGLETTEALGWIENFEGGKNTPFNLTTEWQTCYVLFYVHAEKSQANMDVVKIELKIGTFTWGGEEQGNTVYFDNLQLYLLTNENTAPTLTINKDLPTTFGKGAAKPDLTKYVLAHDLEDARDIEITAANITENVDMSKAGEYDVTYKVADSEGAEATITLKIKVLEQADTTAPVLAEAAGIVKVYDQFADAPDLTKLITATDDTDGAITITKDMITTDADITKAGEYDVTYTVKDTSGNEATLTIKLTVNDKQGPTISGKDTIKTFVNMPITAADVLALLSVKDNVDTTIALAPEDVKGLDQVNFGVAGEYQITVEKSDAAGNKTVYEMTVVVRVNGAVKNVIDQKIIDLAPIASEKAESCVITEADGEYKVEIASLGGWASANKCKFAGLELTEGKVYILKFVAKADEARQVKMNLGIGLWTDPWMDYFTLLEDSAAEIVLGTEYAEHTIMFTYDKPNKDGGPSLEFCVGPTGHEGDKAGNNIYFKEFAIYSTKEVAAEISTEVHDFLKDTLTGENATAEVNEGLLTINPTDIGTWASYSKIKMTGFTIEDGHTYELRVTGHADEARKIQFNIGIGLWTDPWMDKFTLAEEGSNVLELTTTDAEYIIRFTADKATHDGGPTIEFCFGAVGSDGDKAGNKIYISQLKMYEIETAAPEDPDVIKPIVLDNFDSYADTAALTANWAKRYDSVNYSEGFELVEVEGNKVVKFNYASDKKYLLRYIGTAFPTLTDDYKYIRFKAQFASEETEVEVWCYWSGSQMGYNFKPSSIYCEKDGYYYVPISKWGKAPSIVNGFAIGFNYKAGEVAYFDSIEYVAEKPDTEAPVITVSDEVAAQVAAGLKFAAGTDLTATFAALRAGLSANDNVDGEIAIVDSMIDLGGLNLAKAYAGTFLITVTVPDEAGNKAKPEITVVVEGENGLLLDLLHRGLKGENAVVEMNEDVAEINPENVGEWASYAKMKLTNLGLTEGQTYELKITAKADEARKIQFNIGIGLWTEPWMDNFTLSSTSNKVVDLTTDYAEYTIKFKYDKENKDGGPTIEFCVGKVGSDGDKVGNKIYVQALGIYAAEAEGDVTAPVITISETIEQGLNSKVFMDGADESLLFSYFKTGISATDDVDGAITITDDMIDLGGLTPNALVAGDYVITITVKDAAGNEGKKEVPIHVSKYANENLLADLPTTNADYTSTKWTREKYTTEWVSGGTMRSREVGGVRVTNMDNGYGTTFRYTYNKGGAALGIANSLTFKMSNHWSGAEAIQVKVIVIDMYGMSHYLLGSSDAFYEFHVTTGLEEFNLAFPDMEVKAVAFATKSAKSASTYLYVGDLKLTYAGTETNPFTPEQALAYAKDFSKSSFSSGVTTYGDAKFIYVKGIVVDAGSDKGASVQNIKLADSAKGTKSLLVYTVNKKAETDKIYANDELVVSGHIINFGGTIEISSYKDSAGTSYNPKVEAMTTGNGTVTTDTNSSEKAHVTDLSAESGVNGTTFTFKVSADEGYEIDAVKVNGSTVVAVEGVYTATIAGPTTILVQTKKEGAVVLPALTIEGSTETSVGGVATSNLKTAGSGYRQTDGTVQQYYYQILSSQEYYTEAPATIVLTIKIGTGSDKDVDDANAAYVVLLDKDGNEIEGTTKMITKSFKKATETYTVEITPTNAFAGIKIYETKVASWNMRLYEFSVTEKTA